jgi:glutamyl endopeptidase
MTWRRFAGSAVPLLLIMSLSRPAAGAEDSNSFTFQASATDDVSWAVPFGQPYDGTGNLADSQGVSTAATDGFDSATAIPAAVDGGSSPGAIIGGSDNRTRVNPTTGFPYRAVVWIRGVNPAGGSYTCSGFMFGPNAVGTAGHCLYDRGHHGWNHNLTIIPGANGSSQPYGHCGASKVTVQSLYINNGTTTEDYGAIKLSCTVGNTTGWFGFAYPANPFSGWHVTGYPAEKASGTMWTASGSITKQNTGETDYNIDMTGGESGGPVWNGSHQVTAINAYGVGTSYNAGPSLWSARQNDLHAWVK